MKALPDAELVDVRAQGVPQEILRRADKQFGAALVNTRSTTWRSLTDADKSLAALDLIAAHPAVMKRPLIVDGDALLLGWGPEVRQKLSVA